MGHSAEPLIVHAEADGVLLSFIEYRYPTVGTTIDWPDYGCRLASLADLACMKLSAIASRGTMRDFIDVFAMGRECFRLEEMLDAYRRKFSIEDPGHVLMSLTPARPDPRSSLN